MDEPEQSSGRKPWSHTVWPPILVLLFVALGPTLIARFGPIRPESDVFAYLVQRQVGKGGDVVERVVSDAGRMRIFTGAMLMEPDVDDGLYTRETELRPSVLADAGQQRLRVYCEGLDPLEPWPLPRLLEQLAQARAELGIAPELPYFITLQGSSSEEVVLRASSIRPPAGAALCLSLEHLTLVLDNEPLVDSPEDPVLLSLLSTTVVGFDGGPDPALFRGRAIAVHADGARLLGGFGDRPGQARLFDVRTSALLARFDGCLLQELELGCDTLTHGAGVHFEGTTFASLRSAPPEPGSRAGVLLNVVDCPLVGVAPEPGPAREVTELLAPR